MAMQLGLEQVGTPPRRDVYAVRVWTLRGRRWMWAAWDDRGWSVPCDEAGDAARLLGPTQRIPERLYARGLQARPSMWRAITSQATVAEALAGAWGA